MGRVLTTISLPPRASPATSPLDRIAAVWRQQALRWELLSPLAFAGGAAAYISAPVEPDLWMLAIPAVGMGALAWMFRRWGDGWLSFLCLLLAVGSLGAVAGKVRSHLVAAPVLQEPTSAVAIEGVVVEIDAGATQRRLRLAVSAIEGLSVRETPKYVRFTLRGEEVFTPGRSVRCRAMLSPPPSPVVPGDYAFHRDAWFQQLGAVGFSVGECTALPRPTPTGVVDRATLYVAAVRRAIAEHVYTSAGPQGGGMSAAMISGDRSFIEPDDSEALRVSGLAHLISISGVHMVLAGGAFFIFVRMLWPLFEPLALRVPAPRIAAAGAILACTLYFLISGGEVATQRAYIMALIGFGAKLLDRPAISLRSLAVAMVCVVAVQPESVVTPGFQMSFAASAALEALYEIWPRLDAPGASGWFARVRGWVVGSFATSLVASAATFSFALYHFDRAAVWSVLANMAASPVITLWTTPAAVAAAIAAPLGLEEPFFRLMGESIALVVRIAHLASEASPDLSLPVFGVGPMLLAATGLALFVVLRGSGRLLAILPVGLALGMWLGSPRVVGYVATDSAVYVKADQTWIRIDTWRGESGLRPLAVPARPSKPPCDRNAVSMPCVFPVDGGEIRLIAPDAIETSRSRPGVRPPKKPCPPGGELIFIPSGAAASLRIDPCDLAKRGGAAIEAGAGGRRLRLAPDEGVRPWSPRRSGAGTQ